LDFLYRKQALAAKAEFALVGPSQRHRDNPQLPKLHWTTFSSTPTSDIFKQLMTDIFHRHRERSDAIDQPAKKIDCFVALLLAMT
jgi:hypothetical protein